MVQFEMISIKTMHNELNQAHDLMIIIPTVQVMSIKGIKRVIGRKREIIVLKPAQIEVVDSKPNPTEAVNKIDKN